MLRTVRKLSFYTTPARLRQIADNLEKQMAQRLPGDMVPVITEYGPDIELDFTIDQDLWHEERRRKEQAGKG